MSNTAWRRALEQLATEFGCTLELTKGSHYVFKHPKGWQVYTSQSPSDRRAIQYVKADLRRKARGFWK